MELGRAAEILLGMDEGLIRRRSGLKGFYGRLIKRRAWKSIHFTRPMSVDDMLANDWEVMR